MGTGWPWGRCSPIRGASAGRARSGSCCVPERPGGEKVGRIGNDVAPFPQRSLGGVCLVVELGEKDRVRLLPHQQGVDDVRCLPAVGRRALRPPCSPEALLLRAFPRRVVEAVEDGQAALEDRPAVPQCPVRAVPPVHLHVKLAMPTVVDEPGLLRRERARLIGAQQVLREDDPSLQLTPARVLALGQIDRAAGQPVLPPAATARREGRCRRRQR